MGALRSHKVHLDGCHLPGDPDLTVAFLKARFGEPDQGATWRILQWFVVNEVREVAVAATSSEIELGCTHLAPLLDHMPNLRVVVLLGGTARRAHVFLSRTTTARIVSCHHTSAVVMGPVPWKADENVAVFRFIASTT